MTSSYMETAMGFTAPDYIRSHAAYAYPDPHSSYVKYEWFRIEQVLVLIGADLERKTSTSHHPHSKADDHIMMKHHKIPTIDHHRKLPRLNVETSFFAFSRPHATTTRLIIMLDSQLLR